MSDLIDATGEPSGTDDSFKTMARQVQLSVIGVEMRLDAVFYCSFAVKKTEPGQLN